MARTRLRFRLRILFLAFVLTFPVLAVNVTVALAAPNYAHPFWCGKTFYGTNYEGHGWGLDILRAGGAVDGDEVMASAAGRVVQVIHANGEVRINHSQGGPGQGYETVYAHLREVKVVVDQQVSSGQLLGYADTVGNATGPHLHYNQVVDGEDRQVAFYGQPYPYLYNQNSTGPNFTSQHCIPATATDLAGAGFRPAIDWMYAFGYTLGCTPTQFCPSGQLNREQMASFLARLLRLPPTSTNFFTDDNGSIHEADINRIAAAGITYGCGGGQFCPSGVVDRATFATLLGRGIEWTDQVILAPNPPDYFTDDENTGDHEVWINRLRHAGITNGCGSNQYCPAEIVTRDMAAQLFFNAQDHRPWPG